MFVIVHLTGAMHTEYIVADIAKKRGPFSPSFRVLTTILSDKIYI